MVGGVKKHFIEASPIEYLPTVCARREMLVFFRRELFVVVECHCLVSSIACDSIRQTQWHVQAFRSNPKHESAETQAQRREPQKLASPICAD
jgi:hypothetical protein